MKRATYCLNSQPQTLSILSIKVFSSLIYWAHHYDFQGLGSAIARQADFAYIKTLSINELEDSIKILCIINSSFISIRKAFTYWLKDVATSILEQLRQANRIGAIGNDTSIEELRREKRSPPTRASTRAKTTTRGENCQGFICGCRNRNQSRGNCGQRQ